MEPQEEIENGADEENNDAEPEVEGENNEIENGGGARELVTPPEPLTEYTDADKAALKDLVRWVRILFRFLFWIRNYPIKFLVVRIGPESLEYYFWLLLFIGSYLMNILGIDFIDYALIWAVYIEFISFFKTYL